MSGDAQTYLPPPVVWAQRSSTILLTICLEDCEKPDIKILDDSVYFKGIGGTDKKEYEITIHLYKEIDAAKSLYWIRGRNIEFILQKKDEGSFWPHLTKEKVKHHWLKVDFNRWQSEEDSEQEDSPFSLNIGMEDMVRKVAESGGDEGASGKDYFNDMLESDSDDGDLPNLE